MQIAFMMKAGEGADVRETWGEPDHDNAHDDDDDDDDGNAPQTKTIVKRQQHWRKKSVW